MPYSSRHVMQMFKISHQTVRVWSGEFARYLSPTATPGDGRQRSFTDDDLKVFALVAQMKVDHLTYADIHASLGAGLRGEPPLPPAEVMPSEQNSQLMLLQAALEKARSATIELQNQLHASQLQEAETRGENKLLKEQLATAQAEIKTLNREIGRLEAKNDDSAGG